jgi:hypothetical protein
VLQVVRLLDRSGVLTISQSGNDYVLDLVPSESQSLVHDPDYDFWHPAIAYLFKANVNRILHEVGYLIPNRPTTFTSNPYAVTI